MLFWFRADLRLQDNPAWTRGCALDRLLVAVTFESLLSPGEVAWFESQLLDFDVYSNQGNWLYIAGFGTDPRGGRSLNMVKQTADHDPDGVYRSLWNCSS